jgi:hypothetical protein
VKFETPSWDDSPAFWNTFRQKHAAHLQEMQGLLSPHVLELADLRGVDDGLIVEVRLEIVEVDLKREARLLTLILRCGYNQMGYYDLVLRYGMPKCCLNINFSSHSSREVRETSSITRLIWFATRSM